MFGEIETEKRQQKTKKMEKAKKKNYNNSVF